MPSEHLPPPKILLLLFMNLNVFNDKFSGDAQVGWQESQWVWGDGQDNLKVTAMEMLQTDANIVQKFSRVGWVWRFTFKSHSGEKSLVVHMITHSWENADIWVSFPRTGKMAVLCLIFFLSRRLLLQNQWILTTSIDLCWPIMTCSWLESEFWPFPSKKNTFFGTLKWTNFSNFTPTLTLSRSQTFTAGLDLASS